MVPLTDISIYDIASASWYSVTATGIPPAAAIPEPRGAMCTIVSASPDNSSFQITMYGGWNPEAVGGGVDYEDVWVLTVPSFRWIKIDTINDFQANPSLSVGRAHHRCVVHRGQMISVGGSLRFGTQGQVNETMCRGTYPPLRVLDLGTVSWVKTFNTEGVYRVPRVVSEVIGGGAEGGATLTEPEGGWAYTELKSIMALRNDGEQCVGSGNGIKRDFKCDVFERCVELVWWLQYRGDCRWRRGWRCWSCTDCRTDFLLWQAEDQSGKTKRSRQVREGGIAWT